MWSWQEGELDLESFVFCFFVCVKDSGLYTSENISKEAKTCTARKKTTLVVMSWSM